MTVRIDCRGGGGSLSRVSDTRHQRRGRVRGVSGVDSDVAQSLQHQGQLGGQAEQLSVLRAENQQLRAIVAQKAGAGAALAARLERLEAAAAREATLIRR